MSSTSLTLTGTTDPASLARILTDIAGSIAAGTVCLQRGAEFVTLKPGPNMAFELEAAVKKGKQKLTLEVKWELPRETAPEAAFTISAQEPAAPAPGAEHSLEDPVQDQPADGAPQPEGGELAGGALAQDACCGEEEKKEKRDKKGKKK